MINKYLLIIFVAILSCNNLKAQTPSFLWAGAVGGSSYDAGTDIATDANGNVYTIGYFQGPAVDFDPGPAGNFLVGNGGYDIFILKVNANGYFQWVKAIGAAQNDVPLSLALDQNGNILVTGHFFGPTDFDPGAGVATLTSNGVRDIFVLKLDPNGNYLWAKSMGGTGDDFGNAIATDANGNVYTTGEFNGTADFDPGTGTSNLTSNGNVDMFIQKLDANGNFQWATNAGGANPDRGFGITTDATGNVYTTGLFVGTVDFDPGAGALDLTSTQLDAFIQKLDANGNLVWAKSMGGSSWDVGQSICIDADGNVLTTGYFSTTADFDPGTGVANITSSGGRDIFIQKLDVDGNFIWVKKMGGSSDDFGYSIDTDAQGNVYSTGEFSSTADFNPGTATLNLTSAGFSDIYYQKLDENGNFIWAVKIGGISIEIGQSITTDANGDILSTGYFGDEIDFNPGPGVTNLLAVGGDSEVYIQKFASGNCQPTSAFDVQAACGTYTWINGLTYTSSNNTATYIIPNTAGCDSIITLNLTISTQSSASTDIQSACGSYTWINGITYTNSNNIATYVIPNAAGCDSTITLNLTINQPSVSSDVVSACNTFTWINGITYTSSNNTATYVMPNTNGCDSTITLNLTISNIQTTVAQVGQTLTANQTGANYQWVNCNNNYAAIVGETSQSFTAVASGNYAVIINNGNCVDTSVCNIITVVGIAENESNANFTLFPNPTSENISIQFKNDQAFVKVRLISIIGQELKSQSFQNTKLIDYTIEQTKGVYFIEVTNNEGIVSLKRISKQ
jgi:hypothetical protein